MKRVFTDGELPDLFTVVERWQAHWTLVADFLTVLVFVVFNGSSNVTRRSTISDHNGGAGAGEPCGSLPPEAEEIGRALDGEDEGVD